MHILHEIKERMEDELEALCKKETLSSTEVGLIGEMVDIVKDVETVYAMKEYNPEDWMKGYSYGRDMDYSMARAPYERYNEPNSYARGRDAMGRYTSRDDGKQEMIDHLNRMMMNARTPEERESYRNTLEHLSRS